MQKWEKLLVLDIIFSTCIKAKVARRTAQNCRVCVKTVSFVYLVWEAFSLIKLLLDLQGSKNRSVDCSRRHHKHAGRRVSEQKVLPL